MPIWGLDTRRLLPWVDNPVRQRIGRVTNPPARPEKDSSYDYEFDPLAFAVTIS
jgi:hypothetical protein